MTGDGSGESGQTINQPLRLHAAELELLRCFNQFHVRYLVVGGYAVRFYGHERSLKDLDLYIDRSGENPGNCLAALHALRFNEPQLSVHALARPKMQIRLGRYDTELLTTCAGPSFEEAYARHVVAHEKGIDLPIVALMDLIEQKRRLVDPRHHEDIKALERLHGKIIPPA